MKKVPSNTSPPLAEQATMLAAQTDALELNRFHWQDACLNPRVTIAGSTLWNLWRRLASELSNDSFGAD